MTKATCRWPGCERQGRTRRLCPRDYARARKLGDFDMPWAAWTDTRYRTEPSPPCRWPECTSRQIEGRGLCKKHWLRAYRLDDFDTPWNSWGNNVCGGCGETFTGRNRRQKHCSDACALLAWQRRNPERLRELARRHTSRRRALILTTAVERFTEADIRALHGDDCYLCQRTIDYSLQWPDPQSPSMDHVVPLTKGGTHTLDNVAMTHWRCNNRKNASATDKRPLRLTAT